MKENFYNIIKNNSDMLPLYNLINKYITIKYHFLKPLFYEDYMVFGDKYNNCPIILTTDRNHRRLIIVSRYNGMNFIMQPKSSYTFTNFVDATMRSYNYNKSSKELDIDYIKSQDKKIISSTFHKGVVAIHELRDKKFKKGRK